MYKCLKCGGENTICDCGTKFANVPKGQSLNNVLGEVRDEEILKIRNKRKYYIGNTELPCRPNDSTTLREEYIDGFREGIEYIKNLKHFA